MAKKHDSDGVWDYQPDSDLAAAQSAEDEADHQVASFEPVEWSASEYIAHEKSIGWYAALFGVGGLAIVILYLVTGDFLASATVFIACVAVSVYAGRPPATKKYRIDPKGLQVNAQRYPFSAFRSFAIVEEGAVNSVWLIPLKRLANPVVMYLSPEDEEEIVQLLATLLPNEEREMDTVDKVTKYLRF